MVLGVSAYVPAGSGEFAGWSPSCAVRDDYRRDAGCWWLASALSLSAKLRQCLKADTTVRFANRTSSAEGGSGGPFEWVRGPSGALRRLHAIRRRDCRSRQVCRLVGTIMRHSRDYPPGGADTREPTSRPCPHVLCDLVSHDPSCRVFRATEPRGCRTRPRVARCPAGILRNQRGPRLNRIARAVATRSRVRSRSATPPHRAQHARRDPGTVGAVINVRRQNEPEA